MIFRLSPVAVEFVYSTPSLTWLGQKNVNIERDNLSPPATPLPRTPSDVLASGPLPLLRPHPSIEHSSPEGQSPGSQPDLVQVSPLGLPAEQQAMLHPQLAAFSSEPLLIPGLGVSACSREGRGRAWSNSAHHIQPRHWCPGPRGHP